MNTTTQPAAMTREHEQPNYRRELYRSHLRLVMGSLEQLADLNPARERDFLTLLVEVKTIYQDQQP